MLGAWFSAVSDNSSERGKMADETGKGVAGSENAALLNLPVVNDSDNEDKKVFVTSQYNHDTVDKYKKDKRNLVNPNVRKI